MLDLNQAFSVTEAAELVGVAPTEVTMLVFNKLIIPEVHVSTGRGDGAILGARNIKELQLIQQLRHFGVSRSVIQEIILCLGRSRLRWLDTAGWLVGCGDSRDWFLTTNIFEETNRKKIEEADKVFIIKL